VKRVTAKTPQTIKPHPEKRKRLSRKARSRQGATNADISIWQRCGHFYLGLHQGDEPERSARGVPIVSWSREVDTRGSRVALKFVAR